MSFKEETSVTIRENPIVLHIGSKIYNIKVNDVSIPVLTEFFRNLGAYVKHTDNALHISCIKSMFFENSITFTAKQLQDYYQEHSKTDSLVLDTKTKFLITMYTQYQALRANPLPVVIAGIAGLTGFALGALTMRYKMR